RRCARARRGHPARARAARTRDADTDAHTGRKAAHARERPAGVRQRRRQVRDVELPVNFALAWRGGATQARLRRRRGTIAHLPGGTIDLAPTDTTEARAVWSAGTFTEYASAAAFSTLATAMLECGAPIDLVAMAADIAVDELAHVELSARLVMELGGAIPIDVDLALVAPLAT